MGLSLESSGSFDNAERWLTKMNSVSLFSSLTSHAERGVAALASATPIEHGTTAQSWKYRIVQTPYSCTVEWYNTHVHDGVNVAILIQYGHGTGTGGYVPGRDYINPAIKPIFDNMIQAIVTEVSA